MRNILVVLTEAIVIGFITIIIAISIKMSYYKITETLINKYLLIFLSGMIIHLFFEYAGLNESWCRQTYNF
jgi:hypothetical protein